MLESYEIDLGLTGKEIKHILDSSLPIQQIKQPGDSVCWATCLAMVEQWNAKVRSFCVYIRRQSFDCGNCDNNCNGKSCDQARKPTDILSDWHHFGYLETIETPDMLIFPAIREYLKEGRPVQAYFVHKDRKSAHVVLIAGAMKSSSLDDMLLIVDPLKDKPDLIYSMQIAKWGSWERSWVIG